MDQDLVDEIVRGVRLESKVLPALASFHPYVSSSKQYPALNVAAYLARLCATPKGAMAPTHYSIRECVDDGLDELRIAYPSTIRSHMPYLPTWEEEEEGDFHEPALNELSDMVFQSQVEAARRLGHVKGKRSIGVADGHPEAFFGKSYVYGRGRPRRHTNDMTPGARNMLPMFRRRKASVGTEPLFGGTVNGSEPVHASIYDIVTQWNGIHGVRRRPHNANMALIAQELFRPFADDPLALLMGDSEFGKTMGGGDLLAIHKEQGTHLMICVAKTGAGQTTADGLPAGIRGALDRMWTEDRVHLIAMPKPDALTFWGIDKRIWAGDRRHPFYLLGLYRTDPPKDESYAIPETKLKLRVGNRILPVFSAAFYVTFDEEFMVEHAEGIEPIFGLRWSGENVNKKDVRQGARIPSQGYHLRHFSHLGSVGIQNLWQTWRVHREQSRELTRWHPSTAFQTYLEGLRHDLIPWACRPREIKAI